MYNTTMHYIVGLGNPGDKYKKTRHNIGRMSVEAFAEHSNISGWSKSKNANALYTRGMSKGKPFELLLPETFMNKSGDTVKYVVDKHEAKVEDFIVVHDDIALPFGDIKISYRRGAGGNNGVNSIIKQLDSNAFARIRVGIAPKSFWTGKVKRPVGGGPLEQFVLKSFSTGESKYLPDIFEKVQIAIGIILDDGVEKAMNKLN
jgi:PTH1 family peptidyl-tRNA hydrolase